MIIYVIASLVAFDNNMVIYVSVPLVAIDNHMIILVVSLLCPLILYNYLS